LIEGTQGSRESKKLGDQDLWEILRCNRRQVIPEMEWMLICREGRGAEHIKKNTETKKNGPCEITKDGWVGVAWGYTQIGELKEDEEH
jgi:hypothetical protein